MYDMRFTFYKYIYSKHQNLVSMTLLKGSNTLSYSEPKSMIIKSKSLLCSYIKYCSQKIIDFCFTT